MKDVMVLDTFLDKMIIQRKINRAHVQLEIALAFDLAKFTLKIQIFTDTNF